MVVGPLSSLGPQARTQLISDIIHAAVVITVVLCTTMLALFAGQSHIPQDVIGAVYGGAIGYAAGRAGNVKVNNGTKDDRVNGNG
jgi:hypothetical protein